MRTLINQVVVDVDAEAGEIILVVHWKGGMHTELRVPRRRRGQSSQHTSKEIVRAVRVLVRVCSDDIIAGLLNRNGLLTGRGNRWTRERVAALRSKSKIPCYSPDKQSSEGWKNLTQAAQGLGISPITLRLAVERGEIKADPLSGGPWVFHCQALETKAAANLVERAHRRNGGVEISISRQRNINFSSA